MRKIILILGSLILVSNTWAQKKQLTEQTGKKTEVVLETVWEKQFDKPVEDFVMPVENEMQQMISKGKNPMPKVIITKNAIKYYDESDKLNKEIKLQQMYFAKKSPKGKFIGINKIRKMGDETVKDAIFEMIDENGKVVWETKTDKIHIIPSPNGKYAIGLGDTGYSDNIVFYSRGKRKEIKLNISYSMSEIDFTEDGKYWTGWFRQGATSENDKAQVYIGLFDENGNEIWIKKIESINLCWGYGISPNGAYVVVTGPKNDYSVRHKNILFIFDKMGREIFKMEVFGGGNDLYFSNNEEGLLGIAGLYGYVYMVNLHKRELIWDYKSTNPNEGYDSAIFSKNFEDILVFGYVKDKPAYSYSPNKTKEVILSFRKDGKNELKIELSSGTLFSPKVRQNYIFISKNRFFMGNNQYLRIFKIRGLNE